MPSNILAQILSLINLGRSLPQAIDTIIPGADPAFWQKVIARYQANLAPKKSSRKSKSSSRSRKPGKRFASSVPFVLSFAEKQTERRTAVTAELVGRVNGKSEESEPRFVNGNLEVF